MSQSQLYGPSGAFGDNGIKIKEYQNVPKGSPFYYGQQESLLNTPDISTRVNNFMSYNLPSPYKTPKNNFGLGPQIANISQEIIDTQDPAVFKKDPILREPTTDNPFMNVMPMDYDAPPLFADYNRYEKSNYPSKLELKVRDSVKNNFEKGLIQNSDSLLWERLNSQRQFVSQPVGNVPNNQGEFSNWLYGNKFVCKNSSIYQHYGVEYTDDSLTCNGFNISVPTNQGLLNGNLMSSVYQERK